MCSSAHLLTANRFNRGSTKSTRGAAGKVPTWMSRQTRRVVFAPTFPNALHTCITYHFTQHDARCHTQTAHADSTNCKNIFVIRSPNLPADLSFLRVCVCVCGMKQTGGKKSLRICGEISFGWLRMPSAKVARGLYFRPADSKWRGCRSPSPSPPSLFTAGRAWAACGPRHGRAKKKQT